MIAILEAQRAGLLRRAHLLSNIVAGVIVGIVALPLALAFAIATGVKPEQGIYTAIIAGLVVSIFGGSRVQIAGPTGAFVVVLAGVVATHGYLGLQLATIMAGALLVLMGILRMGAILKFIPAPVILGFTAGIGVVIWVGQWPAFFGLPSPEGEHFHEKFVNLARSLPSIDMATTALATLGVLIVIFSPRISALRRVPGPVVALIIVTSIQSVFGFASVQTIGTAFGGIPTGLPTITLPTVSIGLFLDLLGPAFTIAMLGAIESLLSAVVADGMADTRHDSNQELIAQGAANVATASFGGIAATGAIARTATNVRNGGNSPIAGIAHSVVLLAIILFFAPLASNIPLAVLASILFVVAYNMSEIKHVIRMIRRAPVADVAILITTFLLTIFADLVVAVNVGVLLATLQFLRRMASSVQVTAETSPGATAGDRVADESMIDPSSDFLVFRIDGPFFYAAVDAFEHALHATNTNPRGLVIRLGNVPFIDITGLQKLENVIDDAAADGVRVTLCEANARVLRKLERAELLHDGRAIYAATLEDALELARTHTLAAAEPSRGAD